MVETGKVEEPAAAHAGITNYNNLSSPVSRSHISNLHVIDSQAGHPPASLNLTPGQTLITTLLSLFRQEIVKVIRTLCGLWREWGGGAISLLST